MEKLDVGTCVILNDIERPYGRLVAVVVAKQGSSVWCKYLNADDQLSEYNKSGGMRYDLDDARLTPTLLEDFGVELEYSLELLEYRCIQTRESAAKYLDGTHRTWQELCPVTYKARGDILALVAQKTHT